MGVRIDRSNCAHNGRGVAREWVRWRACSLPCAQRSTRAPVVSASGGRRQIARAAECPRLTTGTGSSSRPARAPREVRCGTVMARRPAPTLLLVLILAGCKSSGGGPTAPDGGGGPPDAGSLAEACRRPGTASGPTWTPGRYFPSMAGVMSVPTFRPDGFRRRISWNTWPLPTATSSTDEPSRICARASASCSDRLSSIQVQAS
jgi:hypothetical protein